MVTSVSRNKIICGAGLSSPLSLCSLFHVIADLVDLVFVCVCVYVNKCVWSFRSLGRLAHTIEHLKTPKRPSIKNRFGSYGNVNQQPE